MLSIYTYPKIYVEEENIGETYDLILELPNNVFCTTKSKSMIGRIKSYKRVFVKKIYETAYEEAISLEQSRTAKSFIIYSPKHNAYYLVEKNTEVGLMEIEGLKIFLHVDEGDTVDEGDKIGYQVTRKFEVRNIVSIVRGIIVYIGTIFGEIQRYIVVAVGEENVRKIEISPCK